MENPHYPVLLVCDHASNFIPNVYDDLGVNPDLLDSHIAWDIGSADVVKALSNALEVPAILCSYSRLLVDCNRALDDSSAFPEFSGGVKIEGNINLSESERQSRVNNIYWPYHNLIHKQLEYIKSKRAVPALIAIHTFTPEMNGKKRPWHLGLLWDKDQRLFKPLMKRLSSEGDTFVGDNQPYSGKEPGDFTLDHHAEDLGFPHVGIEIRQDLVSSKSKAIQFANLLASALEDILKDEKLYSYR
ncbi:MAG: N-formylglutamate amidohydrolase [Pseudomonadota bacterium]|nr:N-formylglutamate amidohydrolase [Pseudomonadota bacterium]